MGEGNRKGHTVTTTDANGHDSFSGDLSAGEGVWSRLAARRI
jgi:hypothetical protein